MNAISAFFMQNIVFVYFFYGLAFFSIGLVVSLESGRASEFRFARALLPLALFGFSHGVHVWFEMFQILAAHQGGYVAGVPEETVRVLILAFSFLALLDFGTRLLSDAERHPAASFWQVVLLGALWLFGVGLIYWRQHPAPTELAVAADVLARYSLGIPGALLATWALLRERRDFHSRGMSSYGRDLLWAALAFFVFGIVGQVFTRPSIVYPSGFLNTALFQRTFGAPVQLLRGGAGLVIVITLRRALRAFELEGQLRLAEANRARLEAQAEALEAQERRANEVEALNLQLLATTRELRAMVELSNTLSSTMDLARLLDAALYQIVHSVATSCCGAVFLKQPAGDLELAAEYRRPLDFEPETEPPLEAIVTRSVADKCAVGAGLDGSVQVLSAESFANGRTYRSFGVPLEARGQVFGGLVLSSLRENVPLGAEELRLLTAFSQQMATAIDNARLYQVVQKREAQLGQLVRQLVNAQESERQRIARELHDETGQKLTALAMGLAGVQSQLGECRRSDVADLVKNLSEVADHAIIELRNIMVTLRPSQLDDLGLVPALRWYVNRYQTRHPELRVVLRAGRLMHRLPAEYETVLFRVAQETLTNVARHAKASEVTISLRGSENAAILEVEDNGIGFDTQAPVSHDQGSGWGLVGLRERVSLVGGRCDIASQTRQGTRVVVELPLRREEAAE